MSEEKVIYLVLGVLDGNVKFIDFAITASVIDSIFDGFSESLSDFKQLSEVKARGQRDSDSLRVRHKCLQGEWVIYIMYHIERGLSNKERTECVLL